MSHFRSIIADVAVGAGLLTANNLAGAVDGWAKALTSVAALAYFTVRLYRLIRTKNELPPPPPANPATD